MAGTSYSCLWSILLLRWLDWQIVIVMLPLLSDLNIPTHCFCCLSCMLQVTPGDSVDGGRNVVVRSMWGSVPQWEKWSLSTDAKRVDMPDGVYQYVPAKGEGFPEDYLPFRAYDEAVNAKY